MNRSPLDLSKRERQIVESVYRLGEASVTEILNSLKDPPSYSAVRATLRLLAEKGALKFRQDGKKYLYRPAMPREKASRSALKNMLSTFFGGQPVDAMAALLEISSGKMTADELKLVKKLIEKAQREKRS